MFYLVVVFFATPPIPIYLIGRGYDYSIITDKIIIEIVTVLGDNKWRV